VDLERVRVERLANEISMQLHQFGGSVLRHADDVGDVERWRKAARRAGRLLREPIRTGVSDDRLKVWVALGP
jgi:hypothetical protein